MYADNIRLLREWVIGYTESLATLDFHRVLEKARAAFPGAGGDIDGVAVSRALRAAGFNRDHDAADQKTVTYKRASVD